MWAMYRARRVHATRVFALCSKRVCLAVRSSFCGDVRLLLKPGACGSVEHGAAQAVGATAQGCDARLQRCGGCVGDLLWRSVCAKNLDRHKRREVSIARLSADTLVEVRELRASGNSN